METIIRAMLFQDFVPLSAPREPLFKLSLDGAMVHAGGFFYGRSAGTTCAAYVPSPRLALGV